MPTTTAAPQTGAMSIPEAQASLPPSSEGEIDRHLADLRAHADEWALLPIRDKVKLLWKLRRATDRAAGAWVTAASQAKGLAVGDPLRGEEWSSGPWALLNYLGPLEKTLRAAERGQLESLVKGKTRTRPDGQVVARVMPDGLYDQLLFSGFAVDVWMEPGVTEASLPGTMAEFYSEKDPQGKVAVVLGAGNIASIAPLDVLYKLYAEGQTVLLKLNPVNEYLAPIFEGVFADFIRAGYIRLATGGAAVGEYLTRHDAVDEIHVTGSASTHDAIVYGPGPEGKARKAADTPAIDKRVTSELGGVSPIVVVPGPWTAADLAFQAEHVATQKTHNGGFNCIASQVLVLPEAWDQKDAFLDAVRHALTDAAGAPALLPRRRGPHGRTPRGLPRRRDARRDGLDDAHPERPGPPRDVGRRRRGARVRLHDRVLLVRPRRHRAPRRRRRGVPRRGRGLLQRRASPARSACASSSTRRRSPNSAAASRTRSRG